MKNIKDSIDKVMAAVLQHCGWTPHVPGDPPPEATDPVWVMYRDGYVSHRSSPVEHWSWSYFNTVNDIIAYRTTEPPGLVPVKIYTH